MIDLLFECNWSDVDFGTDAYGRADGSISFPQPVLKMPIKGHAVGTEFNCAVLQAQSGKLAFYDDYNPVLEVTVELVLLSKDEVT